MMYLENYLKNLTDKELEEIFFEILHYNKTGTLKKNGLTRRVVNSYKKEIGVPLTETPESLISFFLFEMARRKYYTGEDSL
ncbi:hypothetical protein AAGG74_15420 [Bacillus mexicanus]|uniref:hypothetical protein n=1 Tax=Bacillus mexicanus TaxID=2834415 RepID=UPI003D1BF961